MDNSSGVSSPSTPTSIRLRRQRGRTPPPPLLVAAPLLAVALALLLLLSQGVSGAAAVALEGGSGSGEAGPAAPPQRLRAAAGAASPSSRANVPAMEDGNTVAVAVEAGAGLGADKAFSLTERARPTTLGGDPASGEMINFGHNQHVVGVRKHHPTVRFVWARGLGSGLGGDWDGRDEKLTLTLSSETDSNIVSPQSNSQNIDFRRTRRWPSKF